MRALLGLLLFAGCEPEATCGLQSSVPGFSPDCDTAGTAFYDEETRVAIGGTGGYLVLYLPAPLEAGAVYGGTSGNPLTALLTLADDQELLGIPRTSSVRVAAVDAGRAELGLSLDFDTGEITGAVTAPVLE